MLSRWTRSIASTKCYVDLRRHRAQLLSRCSELPSQTQTNASCYREFVEVEMRNLLLEKPLDTHPYILHFISSSALVEEIPLQRATKLCTDRPILVVSMCDNIVRARCCVPQVSPVISFLYNLSTHIYLCRTALASNLMLRFGCNPLQKLLMAKWLRPRVKIPKSCATWRDAKLTHSSRSNWSRRCAMLNSMPNVIWNSNLPQNKRKL